MKVALVHDWLTGLRGGERCLKAFLDLYPSADIFTLIHVPGTTHPDIDRQVKQCSFLQNLPGASKLYRLFLPLYPAAISKFNFEGYDLVISLSHAAAKNIKVPPTTKHLCYCFTPMRYIWDQARSYFGAATPALWPMIAWLRNWDRAPEHQPQEFVAISRFVASRIRCFYKRTAEVIFPPVDSSWIKPVENEKSGEAFLYAGALVPYKRPDLIVEAFNQLGDRLWVVGEGPERKRLESMAKGNIKFFGRVPDAELAEYYRRSRALIFPGVEDFGMIPVESMAAGRPVIGLYAGGLKETVVGLRPWLVESDSGVEREQATGVFILNRPGAELQSLLESIRYFRQVEGEIKASSCVERAQSFSPERFYSSWEALLAGAKSSTPSGLPLKSRAYA